MEPGFVGLKILLYLSTSITSCWLLKTFDNKPSISVLKSNFRVITEKMNCYFPVLDLTQNGV